MWPKLPKQWILGQVSGVAVDARDHVWIIQRPWSLNDDEKAKNPEAECCTPAPPVMEFDAAGNYLQGWGGERPGYEWPKDEHSSMSTTKATSGSVGRWTRLRERTENQILKFTQPGSSAAGRTPRHEQGQLTPPINNAVTSTSVRRRTVVFVADGVNRRHRARRRQRRAWARGRYGNTPDDTAEQAGRRRSRYRSISCTARV